MNINQNDIITTTYLFLVAAGLITLFAGVIVYYHKKSKLRR